jgi:hypothetical protein
VDAIVESARDHGGFLGERYVQTTNASNWARLASMFALTDRKRTFHEDLAMCLRSL